MSEYSNDLRETVTGDSSSRVDGGGDCRCGISMGKWTSWTKLNPARRFYGCKNFRDVNKFCKDRAWIDPELTDYYKDVMNDLKEKARKWEELEAEQRKGMRPYQSMHLTKGVDERKFKAVGFENENENESLRSLTLHLEENNEKLRTKYMRMKEKAQELQINVAKCKGKEQVYICLIGVLLVVIALLMMSNGLVVKQKMLPF